MAPKVKRIMTQPIVGVRHDMTVIALLRLGPRFTVFVYAESYIQVSTESAKSANLVV